MDIMPCANRKRELGTAFLVFVAVILVATLPAELSASTAYPCTGTLNGSFAPGAGTISILGTDHKVTTSSVVTGTFDGDTTGGGVVAKVTTNYTVPSMSLKGHVVSDIKGTYVMSIDASGTITGTATIPLNGDFVGQVKITLQGQESQNGQMEGTWTGTLNVTQVTYQMIAVPANIGAPGSGTFTGTEQRPTSTQTVASTSSVITTTSMIPSTSALILSTAVQPSTTAQPSTLSVSYLPYALVVVIALVIIVVAAYAVRMRRPKKS